MKSQIILKLLFACLATSCLNQYYINSQVYCEKLSTVFVLETSDSQPQSSVSSADSSGQASSSNSQKEQRSISDDNTKIITDDVQSPQTNDSNNKQQPSRKPPVSRNNNNQQTIQQPINQPINVPPKRVVTTTTTTTTIAPRVYTQPSSEKNVPKEENRLLISIQSDSDDYRPIVKQPSDSSSVSISGNDNDNKPSKPIITLSFQDVNKHKGTLIVRPSENGQSIVISTVGDTQNSNSGSQILSNNYQNQNVNSGYNNDQSPYREPVNQNPYQAIIPSTSRRPASANNNNNDYTTRPSNNNVNRPIVSTLVDTPIRPSNDDSPSRPTSSSINGGYSEPSRPIRPTQNVLLPSSDSSSGYTPLNGGAREPDITSPSSSSSQSEQVKHPLNENNCGLMEGTRIVGGDEVNHDEYLWMAALISAKPTTGEAKPFCGGSLITRRHILTAAHCLENLTPRDVLVRLGSYDFDDATSSATSGDYAVDQFKQPANYSKKTHSSDIAILRLKYPLSTSDNYKTICMPQARRSYVGALGTVIGYGSQSQQFRRAASKLRQVQVPIWENRKCGMVYKKNITETFMCAGFEEGGKDACQGDSGGPMMIVGPNERMMIVGVVSHGIGCGGSYPGVYTRVSTFSDWIDKNTRD